MGKSGPQRTLRLPDCTPGPVWWAAGTRSHGHSGETSLCTHVSPSKAPACLLPVLGNPALHPEPTISLPPSFFKSRSRLSSAPDQEREEEGTELTVHRNLDGPSQAEEAEEEGCVDPGWWLRPGHLSAGRCSPFPGPWGLAASSCSHSASGQSSAVERKMTSELFLKLVVCSSNPTGLEGCKHPRGHRPVF